MTDTNNTITPIRYLRWKQVRQLVPAHRVTTAKWVREGRFPVPFQLNPGQMNTPIAWREDEILEWQSTRQRGFGPGTPSAWVSRRQQALQRRKEQVAEARRLQKGETGADQPSRLACIDTHRFGSGAGVMVMTKPKPLFDYRVDVAAKIWECLESDVPLTNGEQHFCNRFRPLGIRRKINTGCCGSYALAVV